MSRKMTLLLLTLLAICLIPASCRRSTPPGSGEEKSGKRSPVLARINDEVITVDDFQAEIDSLPEYTKRMLTSSEQKRKHLEGMIKERLLLQEAKKRGLDQDKETRRKVDRYRSRLLTESLYKEVDKEQATVSDAEVQKYYDEHKDQYIQKERIRVSQILILLPPGADKKEEAAIKAKAEGALKKVKAGGDFAKLSDEYSQGPMAGRGGDLGYISRGRMPPEFEEVVFSLKNVGDTSQIIKTRFGYHIVRLTDKQPAKQLELAEVSDRIKRQLESMKRRDVRQTLDQNLRKDAVVEIDEEFIKEDVAEAPPAADRPSPPVEGIPVGPGS